MSATVWCTPYLYNEGLGNFIDNGLGNLFSLSVSCDIDSFFFLLYQEALKAACLVFLENK